MVTHYLEAVWMVFFVTQFPSLITLKYHTHLTSSLTCYHSIFFTLFVGPIPVTRCIFFFLVPSTQKPEPSEIKKNKNKNLNHPNPMKEERKKNTQITQTQWKKKEEHSRPNPGKKKVDWSKGAAELWLVIPHVCLIKKMSLSYELWKLMNQTTS